MISFSQKEVPAKFGLSVNKTVLYYSQRHILRIEPAFVALVLAEIQVPDRVEYNLVGSGLLRGIILSLLTPAISDYAVQGIPDEWAQSNALGKRIVDDITGVKVWARPDSVVWVNTTNGVSEIKPSGTPFELGDIIISNK